MNKSLLVIGSVNADLYVEVPLSKDKRNGVDAVRWPGAIHLDVSGEKALNEGLKIEKMRSGHY